MAPRSKALAKPKAQAATTHLFRHTRHQMGMSVEEIAAADGVSPETVLKSITKVDAFKMANTMEMLKPSLIDTVLGRKEKVDRALEEALEATVTGREGVQVPNHTVRLEAIEKWKNIAQVAQPKTPGRPINFNANINQQNAVVTPVPGGPRYEGFEERLRSAQKKIYERNELPPPESVAAPLGEDELGLADEEETVNGEPEHTEG